MQDRGYGRRYDDRPRGPPRDRYDASPFDSAECSALTDPSQDRGYGRRYDDGPRGGDRYRDDRYGGDRDRRGGGGGGYGYDRPPRGPPADRGGYAAEPAGAPPARDYDDRRRYD